MAEYNNRYQGGQGGAAPAVWDIFKVPALKLYGSPWDPADRMKAPSIQVHVTNCSPRMKLYMNDGSENKAYSFNLKPASMFAFFEAIKTVATSEEPDKIGWQIKSNFPHSGPRTEKPTIISTLSVGRDNEGVVYLAFQVKGLQVAKFPFGSSSFFEEMIGPDGEKLNPVTASSICAKGWVTLFSELITTHLAVRSKEPPPSQSQQRPPQTQPSQGGQGGQVGGWAATDDDIPF